MKMYRMIVIVTMLTIAVFVMGCNKGTNGTVLAKVNRDTITEADFKKQLEDLTPQMQQAVATDAKARREFGYCDLMARAAMSYLWDTLSRSVT